MKDRNSTSTQPLWAANHTNQTRSNMNCLSQSRQDRQGFSDAIRVFSLRSSRLCENKNTDQKSTKLGYTNDVNMSNLAAPGIARATSSSKNPRDTIEFLSTTDIKSRGTMKNKKLATLLITVGIFGALSVNAQDNSMGFFVTSAGPGRGGDLGGLEGADAHCQELAAAVGAGKRQWRAYLSTEEDGKRGVSARDRIGQGPWYNAKAVLIAENITELHLYNKTITKETALNEKGELVNGRGDKPNEHDMLTGSMDDGTAYFPDDQDHTCNNWTSSNAGSAQVGHHDRHGGGNLSWTSAHGSKGCSLEALAKTGGNGRFYCFAAD